MVGTRHHQKGYSQAPPPPRGQPSHSIQRLQNVGVDLSSSSSEDEEDRIARSQFTQRSVDDEDNEQ
jgi:hypothetical protein